MWPKRDGIMVGRIAGEAKSTDFVEGQLCLVQMTLVLRKTMDSWFKGMSQRCVFHDMTCVIANKKIVSPY